MKKLSEFTADQATNRRSAQAAYRKRCRAVLDGISEQDIEPYSVTGRTIEQRDKMRQGLQDARLPLMGIACDHCGTELVNHRPNLRMASKPPKKHIGCPGCGWTGHFSVR